MKSGFRFSQVAGFRVGRHFLAERARGDVAAVAGRVCGIQAQVPSAARIGLWARTQGLAQSDIEDALWRERSLVMTSLMRGTLHWIPADDYWIYILALKASRLRAMRGVTVRYGVSEKESRRVTDAVVEILADGPATRKTLTERILSGRLLAGRSREWFQASWWGVVRQSMVEGTVCYGGQPNGEATYVLVDQWLGDQPEWDEREAGRELIRRYLKAYGPATLRDFSHWSGIRVSESRPLWAELKSEMVEVTVQGSKRNESCWLLREVAEALSAAPGRLESVRLLPYFDVYLLGHVDKDPLVDPEHYQKVFRQAGWISPVVLSRGRVTGTWSLDSGNRAAVRVEPFGQLSAQGLRKLQAESASLGDFLKTGAR